MSRSRLPSTQPGAEQPDVRWPPERFYWSVLDVPGWTKTGVLPEGFWALVAGDIPGDHDAEQRATDPLHAVCAPIDGDRIVVCAAARSAIVAITTSARSLSPFQLPERIPTAAPFDPSRLNLLVGDLEPASIRRQRRRHHMLAAMVVLLCAGLVAVGLGRRAARWNNVTDQAGAARDQILARLATPTSSPAGIAAELARLKRTSDALAHLEVPPDAAATLARLLRAWPASVPCKPQSVAIAGRSASLSVLVEGDPAPFLQALKPPPGWTLDEPRLNTAGATTRLSLSLRREAERSSEGGRP